MPVGAGRKPTIDDEEILREIALAPDPIVTAPELSDRTGLTRQGIRNRLLDLVDEGYIRERKVGSRAKVYWLTQDGREILR